MWSSRKAYMVAKTANVKIVMQCRRNAQQWYCAGPRLDRTRHASLEHQQLKAWRQQAQRNRYKENFWVGNLKGQKINFSGLFCQFWAFRRPHKVGQNFICWRFWVVARWKWSSYAKVMTSQSLLSKTIQFGLNSVWSSRNRGQPDLDADLIFFCSSSSWLATKT
jgi:hypothetical protein